MLSLIEPCILVAALCADAFAASFLYGTDQVRIPPLSVFIITALSTAILFFSLVMGNAASLLFPEALTRALCFLVLFALGLIRLFDSSLKSVILKGQDSPRKLRFSVSGLHFILTVYADPQKANEYDQSVLSPAEAFSVGLAMSLDSAAAGLGAGLTDFPLIPTLLLAFLSGAAAVRLGCLLGSLLSRRLSINISWLSGGMLIVLAFLKLL